MEKLYLIETATVNGVHKYVIDRACVKTIDLANEVKKIVDDKNKSSTILTSTSIHPVTLYNNEFEIPVFHQDDSNNVIKEKTHKEMAKELQERLVQCCIDYINENGDKDIQEVHFNADELQESAKNKEWSPCTDSFIELCSYKKEDNGLDYRNILAVYN